MMKLKRAGLRLPAALLLSLAVLHAAAPLHRARAQTNATAEDAPAAESAGRAPIAYGSLEELKGKTRVTLIVIRPRTVSAADSALTVADAVRAGAATEPRHGRLHDAIARKLNDYIKKYRSMAGVTRVEDADYVVVFNLLRFRRVLNTYYPTGEMFVVTYKEPGPPRVLWRTPKEMFYDDATKKLIEALKRVRGEK